MTRLILTADSSSAGGVVSAVTPILRLLSSLGGLGAATFRF
jgi:hypothetical protein